VRILFILCLMSVCYTAQAETPYTPVQEVPFGREISPSTVTVDTVVVALPPTAMVGRKEMIIVNMSDTVEAYLTSMSDSSVALHYSIPLYPRQGIRVDVDSGLIVYGYARTAVNLRVWELK